MEKNVGRADVTIRVLVGLIAVYLAFAANVWWSVVAIIAFGTALRKSCLLYTLLGISTVEKKKEAVKVKSKPKKKTRKK